MTFLFFYIYVLYFIYEDNNEYFVMIKSRDFDNIPLIVQKNQAVIKVLSTCYFSKVRPYYEFVNFQICTSYILIFLFFAKPFLLTI